MTKEETRRLAERKRRSRVRAVKGSIVAVAIASVSLIAVFLSQG